MLSAGAKLAVVLDCLDGVHEMKREDDTLDLEGKVPPTCHDRTCSRMAVLEVVA